MTVDKHRSSVEVQVYLWSTSVSVTVDRRVCILYQIDGLSVNFRGVNISCFLPKNILFGEHFCALLYILNFAEKIFAALLQPVKSTKLFNLENFRW